MFIILLIFIFLGSFVGGLSFWSGLTLYSVLMEPNGEGSLLTVLMLSVFGYPVSLLYGCVPAAIAGLWYGMLLKHRTMVNYTPGKRLLMGLAMGFLVASLFAIVIGIPLTPAPEGTTDSMQRFSTPGGMMAFFGMGEFIPTFALPGALAAAVCSLCVSDRLYARRFGR
ncbi:MAG: hypothetical protein G8345_11910 [Magnetococcales bacterium]|nr:hypothetical protein [Magnetococcales bacterium]NGZ27577.1 hypothetical protein [Magnetococcales bacterium]